MGRWVGGSVSRWVGGWMGRWVGRSVGRSVGGSVSRWVGESVGRWVGGWMGRWVGGLTPCRQLGPSSRREHVNSLSKHKLFIKTCTAQLVSRNLKSLLV